MHLIPVDIRLSDLRARRKDLELRAVLHGETLREKNQQIQVYSPLWRGIDIRFCKMSCWQRGYL
jgi:hypothetical protein